MTTGRIQRTSRLGLAALAILITGTAFGQATGSKYSVTVLGSVDPEQMSSLGIDAYGRVAGNCGYFENGHFEKYAWTHDPKYGFVISPAEDSTINAVSPDGLLVGSAEGHPSVFDWMGNAKQVVPGFFGQFMAINNVHVTAGYLYDPKNAGVQTAYIWDRNFNMIRIGAMDRTASAVLGINDNGVAVGFQGNSSEKSHAVCWNGRTVVLPAPVETLTCANGVNNWLHVVGYGVTAKNQVLPLKWVVTALFSKLVPIPLPDGYLNGNAQAINDCGQIAGTMWKDNGELSRAFVTRPDGRVADLNDLMTADASRYTLISAGAINAKGLITGIASVRSTATSGVRLVAYVATPVTTAYGKGP